MVIAIYIGKAELLSDERFVSLVAALRDGGCAGHVLQPDEFPSD